ncbi:MAG: CPBP family intramembrane glutamic endopeptidase [Phycisphaerales bacterium]
MDSTPPPPPPTTTGPGEPPNSPVPAFVLWAACIVSFLAVLIANQFGEDPPKSNARLIQPPDTMDPLAMQTKLGVKLGAIVPQPASYAQQIRETVKSSTSNADRLRAAIALGEFEGSAAGLKQLDDFGSRTLSEDEAPLADDATVVKMLLADPPDAPSPEQLAALRERHGFFADLALARGKPAGDASRAGLESGGLQIVLVALFAIIGGFIAFVGAIVALVILINKVTGDNFRRHLVVPKGGASTVYLESFALFLGGFALLHLGLPWLLGATGVVKPGVAVPAWLTTFRLGLQWSLLLTIFWPLLRGVTVAQWKEATGWHRGRGTAKEIGCGLVGYGALLPCLFIVLLMLLFYVSYEKSHNPDAAPPSNPVADLVMGASPFQLLLAFALMTIWAPVVEETFFRGILYRHLRGRMGIVASTAISALWFGLMHGYSGILLLPVITIGAGFALIREWRGSLIPTVLAHALHNFAIGALAIGFFTAFK